MFWSAIGVAAALLTSSGFIPQILKGIRSRKLDDVSSGMLLIWILGTALWFCYGWHLEDVIIMGANVFTCSCGCVILFMKVRFREIADSSSLLPVLKNK